jgi:hypothetical protein
MVLAPEIWPKDTGMPSQRSRVPQRPGPISIYGLLSALSRSLRSPISLAMTSVLPLSKAGGIDKDYIVDT